jgi:hypothetical protein
VPKKKIERKKEFDLSVTSLMIERMQVQSWELWKFFNCVIFFTPF